jgi:hypothetical protein
MYMASIAATERMEGRVRECSWVNVSIGFPMEHRKSSLLELSVYMRWFEMRARA